LKSRDQQAFLAENSPAEFIADLENWLSSRDR
jgi:hypothetical protein